MNYEEKAREIADGLAGYIAEPRRTELAEEIAAALREAVEEERGKLDLLQKRLEKRWDRLAWGDDYEMLKIIDPDYSWPCTLSAPGK